VPLKKAFGSELKSAEPAGMTTENGGLPEPTDKVALYFHYYENFYTPAYIAGMWGLMRHGAFPGGMKL